jgi:hypothetical protein
MYGFVCSGWRLFVSNDLFELEIYYNEIRGELRTCEDEDDWVMYSKSW